jgi:hypothetical protein
MLQAARMIISMKKGTFSFSFKSANASMLFVLFGQTKSQQAFEKGHVMNK